MSGSTRHSITSGWLARRHNLSSATIVRLESAGRLPRAMRTPGGFRRWPLELLPHLDAALNSPPTYANYKAVKGGATTRKS